jgi:hypothetical protein
MITPQRDPNSLVRTKTLAEIAGQDYSATDYGVVEGLKATSLATIERNFTVTAADWVKQYDERRDMKMGMYAPVTQEEYDKSPAAKYGLEFRANENPFSFERRIQKAAKLRHYDDVAQGQDRQVSQLVASLGVGLVSDPVNFIGLGTGASVAKGALYANAGKKAAAAYHTGKGTFKNVLAYGAAFEVPYAFMSNDLGVEKYTYDHLKMAAAMNTVFAGLLSGVSAGASYRNASKVAKAKSDYATYTQFMEGDVPMNDAFSNIYDAGSNGIVEAIKQNKRLVDIAEGRVLADELTLDDMFNMSALMRAHETSTKTTTMVASLADKFLAKLEKGDTSIYKAQREYKGQVKRLTEAVLFGKFDELSYNDIQFLKDNDFELRKQGEDVEDNKGGNQLHASYTVTENYGMVTKAEASANQLVVDASIEARVLEKEYFELIEDGRRGEAMDMKPRLDEAKKVVDDLFGETYARMVEDINGMVNEVLLGDKKIIPVRIEKQMSSSGVQGWKYPSELRNYIAEPHMVFASSEVTTGLTNIPVTEVLYTRVLSTLFHEAWHNVKEINITSYNQLLDVASSPEVKKAMRLCFKNKRLLQQIKDKGSETGNV